MEIRNIIFDFGGVLIDWNPEYLYKDVFCNKEEMDFFLGNICNSEWNLKQDAGRSFNEAIKELTNQFPQYENEIKIYYSDWIKMVGGAIEKNTSLLPELKQHFRLFGLTNWSAETLALVLEKYSFFKDFEAIVVSGTEKITKPDQKIYQLLLDRYQLKAEESLFIDDNMENIRTAKSLGFKTIFYHKGVDLKCLLGNIGT